MARAAKKLSTEERIEQLLGELKVMREESNKKFEEMQEVSNKKFEESNKKFDAAQELAAAERRRSDLEFKKLHKSLGDQMRSYGSMVESLVDESIGELLKDPKLTGAYAGVAHNVIFKVGSKTYDVDRVLSYKKAIILVDIKSFYKPGDLSYFQETLLPGYLKSQDGINLISGRPVYACSAALRYEPSVLRLAPRAGIRMVKILNDNARIVQMPNFTPKVWNA